MKWFKMDCDAQENLDMRKLIDEWGWDWYGRYHAILGKVGMCVTEKRLTFALQTNDGCPFPVRLLANDLSTTVERLTDFCRYLSDNHLIDKKAWDEQNLIFVPKMAERADEYIARLVSKSGQTPDSVGTKNRRRTDKKRVEKTTTRLIDYTHLFPGRLATLPGFKDAWADWQEFRSTTKKPLTEIAVKKQLKFLAKQPDPIETIEQAIRNQWQGLYEVKNGANRQSGNPNSAAARATFRVENADDEVRRTAESIAASRRARDERAGSDSR